MLIDGYKDTEVKRGDRVRIIASVEELDAINIGEDIHGEMFYVRSIEGVNKDLYLSEDRDLRTWKWWVKENMVEVVY